MKDTIDLKLFLVNILCDLTELPEERIRTDIDLGEYGVDSLMAVMLVEEINNHFRYEIADYSDISDMSTIDEISLYLEQRIKEEA